MYRSSYELEAYKLLDCEASKAIIKFWQPCNFSIQYSWKDNSIHRYIPDIFIEYKSGKKQIIEIKPNIHLQKNYNRCIEKSEAGKEYCKEKQLVYSIWTERELGIN